MFAYTIFVFIYLCIHISLYSYIFVFIYICIHIYLYSYIFVFLYICIHMNTVCLIVLYDTSFYLL